MIKVCSGASAAADSMPRCRAAPPDGSGRASGVSTTWAKDEKAIALTNRPVRGWSVGFSPDGTRLAVGWEDGHLGLRDVPGRRLVRVLVDREYPYPCPYFGQVAFCPVWPTPSRHPGLFPAEMSLNRWQYRPMADWWPRPLGVAECGCSTLPRASVSHPSAAI